MNLITQVHQKSSVPIDTLCKALLMPRATYYRHQQEKQPCTKDEQKILPKNALSPEEKQKIIELLHSEEFIDKTPYDVYHSLLDEGRYYCSTRTMYRLLEEREETKDRRTQRNHRDAIKPELIATRPNEVWSWDITKLRSSQKWVYFYLYVILDIFSRYVVGWLIAERESKELARRLIQQTALKQGVQPQQLTLHSDNGPCMTSQSVAQLLDHLGIIKTHNRPYTSDDNPFSESQFKTLKYCPEFPGQFDSLNDAEAFSQGFFNWYNKDHYHSGIAWLTPESVHYGHAQQTLEKRHQARMEAFIRNPGRFQNREPKQKELPKAVYINPPQTIQIGALQKENAMV
jgi:transposase InsO family protein